MFEPLTHNKKKIAATLIGICILLSGIAIALTIRLTTAKNDVIAQAHKNAYDKTVTTAKDIDNLTAMLKPLVKEIAQNLNNGSIAYSTIAAMLKNDPTKVSGLGVAFAPHAYSTTQRLYAPYNVHNKGADHNVQLDTIYDYTTNDPENDWFNKAMNGQELFFGPITDRATGSDVVGFAAPFYAVGDSTQKPIGVVFATQSMEYLDHILTTLSLGQRGYWFTMADNGIILGHPTEKLLFSRTSIFALAKQLDQPSLAHEAQKALSGKQASTTYDNEITGNPSWIFFEPLPFTGWTLAGVFDKQELPLSNEFMRHTIILIMLAVLCILILMIILYLVCTYNTYTNLWIVFIGISLLLCLGIGALWYIANRYPLSETELFKELSYGDHRITKEQHIMIPDKLSLYAFLDDTTSQKLALQSRATIDFATANTYLVAHETTGNYVPTGIFIRHLHFVKEDQIEIAGFIWQRYLIGKQDALSRGVILPQALEVQLEEASRSRQGNQETILWNVRAKLGQNTLYRRYPFDVKDADIRLWHRDFEKNVILVPDFDSYTLLNKGSLPGIDEDVSLPGWYIEGSFFSYTLKSYNALFGLYANDSFGMYNRSIRSSTPELTFNVIIHRELINTLVEDLLTLAVILVLLFIVFITTAWQEWAILGSYAAIFFGIVLEHIRFRGKIPSDELVYFESFYLILYAALLLSTTFSVLQLTHPESPLFARNNFMGKILYWPLVLTGILIITVYYLY